MPIKIEGNTLIIDGGSVIKKDREIEIKESASTLRMLTPLLSYYSQKKTTIKTSKNLFKRGIKTYVTLYKENGKKITKNNTSFLIENFPVLKTYNIDATESSQYISGIALLAPNLGQKTTININGNTTQNYVDLTVYIMRQFGAKITRTHNCLVIDNQEYKPTTFVIPEDNSFKTNLEVINFFGSSIKFGESATSSVIPEHEVVEAIKSKKVLDKKIVDLTNCPDAIFALSLLFLYSNKNVKFINTKKLKNKETNRTEELSLLIEKLGGKIETHKNSISIFAASSLCLDHTITIESHGDHRIVLAGLIASTLNKKPTIIKNYECIKKSVPNFLNILDQLGIKYKTKENNETKTIETPEANSEIIFTDNITKTLQHHINKNTKNLIVTDKNTPKKFVKSQNLPIYETLETKENVKTLQETERLINYLLKNNFSKSDYIIAYGGGTITDLVGFVSSIYKRGINHINVPTTLVGQVDAAIGGKTAINIQKYKNQIGTFKLPVATIINFETLESLPEKETKSGMAEIIKIAATSNKNLFYDILDSKPYENLRNWVKEAIETKLSIVSKDLYDKKERKILNFGHTYGHALELTQNITHGEAVAKGMMIVSQNKNLESALLKYGFDKPTKKDVEEAKQQLLQDKKIQNNTLSIIKLEEIGKPIIEKTKI